MNLVITYNHQKFEEDVTYTPIGPIPGPPPP